MDNNGDSGQLVDSLDLSEPSEELFDAAVVAEAVV